MNKQTWNLFTLLSLTLTCIPLSTMQCAAELRPDNIYPVLSGIEDLQDGTWRSIEKVNHICNDFALNVDLHSLFAELAAAGEEGHELLLRIGTDFHIVIPGITPPPFDDDYNDGDNTGADPDGEVTGTNSRTPELPNNVLEFLCNQLGLTSEATENLPPQALVDMQKLPDELFGLILTLNPERHSELSSKISPQLQPIPLKVNGMPLDCRSIYSFGNNMIEARDQNGIYYLFNLNGQHIPLETGRDEKITSISSSPPFILAKDENGLRHLFEHDGTFIRTLEVDRQPLKIRHRHCSIDTRIWVEDENRHLHLFTPEGIHIRTLKIGDEPLCFTLKLRSYPEVDRLLLGPHLFTFNGTYLATLTRDGRSVSYFNIWFCPQHGNIIVFTIDNKFCLFDLSGNLMEIIETGIDEDVMTSDERYYSSINIFTVFVPHYQILLFTLQGQWLGITRDGKPMDCLKFDVHHKLQIITLKTHDDHWHVLANDFRYIPLLIDGKQVHCTEIKCYSEENLLVVLDNHNHYHLFRSDGTYLNTLRANGLPIEHSLLHLHICSKLNRLIARGRNWIHYIFTLEGEYIGTFKINNQTCTAWSVESAPESQRIIIDINRHSKPSEPGVVAPLGTHLFTPDGTFIATLTDNVDELFPGHGFHELASYNLLAIPQETGYGKPYRLFRRNGEPVSHEECMGGHIMSFEGKCQQLDMLTALDASKNTHLFATSIRQLKQGLSPAQLLMLHLLSGLKANWKRDFPEVPFSTCPADITCAILLPLLKFNSFKRRKIAQTKARFKIVHNWVLHTLSTFRCIQLQRRSCFEVLRATYGIENDPIVHHKTSNFVASGYLLPYVRLRNEKAVEKIQALAHYKQAREREVERHQETEEAINSICQDQRARIRERLAKMETEASQLDEDIQDKYEVSNNELFSAASLLD